MPEKPEVREKQKQISSSAEFPMLLACGVFAVSILFAIFSSRCLYADGSYYFLKALQAGQFTAMFESRSFADYLFQFPLVIAVKLGITNIHLLTLAFGIGCFCAWPVAMCLCYLMARERFWLVMLACAAGYLNAAFMAVGEHIVAHAFFWPALFAILFVRPMTPMAAVILLGSSAILVRSYESLLFLGPVMVLMILWRIATSGEKLWQRLVLVVSAGLSVCATWIALGAARHPVNPANMGEFKSGIITELQTPPWTLAMTYFGMILILGLRFPAVRQVLKRPVGLALTGLIILVWGLWPIIVPDNLFPPSQYVCRFLNLLVPLALMPLAWLLAAKPKLLASYEPDLIRLCAAILAAQSLWHISMTYQWQGYADSWRHLLVTKRGPLFLSKIYGRASAVNHQSLRFDWQWANPGLSVFLGPSQVQAMILPGAVVSWQPFDPLNPQSFPDLAKYGVNYSVYSNYLAQQKSGK